jgi:hypothetical protein
LAAEKSRSFSVAKKSSVDMGDVMKEICHHMPQRFLYLHILLPTNMAIPSLHSCAPIQAILFFPLRSMRQCKNLLKNKYKNTSSFSFSLTVNPGNFEHINNITA